MVCRQDGIYWTEPNEYWTEEHSYVYFKIAVSTVRCIEKGDQRKQGEGFTQNKYEKSGMFKRLAIFIAKSMSSISCNEKCEQEDMVNR